MELLKLIDEIAGNDDNVHDKLWELVDRLDDEGYVIALKTDLRPARRGLCGGGRGLRG